MEQGWFCQNMEGYTDNFVGHDDEWVISQHLEIIGVGRQWQFWEKVDNSSTRLL
jgi:hypothetical protein